MICFHEYLPWSDPIQPYQGGYKQQWTVCKECNKAKHRTLGWDKQSVLSDVINALNQTRDRHEPRTSRD